MRTSAGGFPIIGIVVLLLFQPLEIPAGEAVAVVRALPPLSVRGVNYFPRETPWGGMWTNTPAAVWGQDMQRAASLGVNVVRTFLPFSPRHEAAGLVQPDGAWTPAFRGRFESLLDAAWRNRIRVIVCLEFHPGWLAESPSDARWRRAVAGVVGAHRDDGRVLLWDLMNEPDDDAKWTEGTRAYLREALPLVRDLDTNHLSTVGLAWRTSRLQEVGLPGVLQYHEYAPKADLFAQGAGRIARSIAGQRRVGGARPLLIGEFGLCTARDPAYGADPALRDRIGEAPGTEAEQARLYGLILAAAEEARVAGVLPWCLHDYPIRNPNESHFGLVRADGSLKPAAAVLRETYGRWRAAADLPDGAGTNKVEKAGSAPNVTP